MSIHVTMDGWVSALLLSVRVASAIAFAPVVGTTQIPGTVKVLLAIALGASLAAMLPAPQASALTLVGLCLAVIGEVVIGSAFGFGLLAAHAATQVAGRVLDVQIGFGAASVLNPTTQQPSPLIGTLLGTVMLAAFLALDGHLLLIKVLASLPVMLTTALPAARMDIQSVILQSSVIFSFGLTLAAPVMFALLLTDVAMSVFARSMPQLNVFVLSFAIKIMLGLVGLALSLQLNRRFFAPLIESLFAFWSRSAVTG